MCFNLNGQTLLGWVSNFLLYHLASSLLGQGVKNEVRWRVDPILDAFPITLTPCSLQATPRWVLFQIHLIQCEIKFILVVQNLHHLVCFLWHFIMVSLI